MQCAVLLVVACTFTASLVQHAECRSRSSSRSKPRTRVTVKTSSSSATPAAAPSPPRPAPPPPRPPPPPQPLGQRKDFLTRWASYRGRLAAGCRNHIDSIAHGEFLTQTPTNACANVMGTAKAGAIRQHCTDRDYYQVLDAVCEYFAQTPHDGTDVSAALRTVLPQLRALRRLIGL